MNSSSLSCSVHFSVYFKQIHGNLLQHLLLLKTKYTVNYSVIWLFKFLVLWLNISGPWVFIFSVIRLWSSDPVSFLEAIFGGACICLPSFKNNPLPFFPIVGAETSGPGTKGQRPGIHTISQYSGDPKSGRVRISNG